MTHTRQGYDMSPSSINRWINASDPINLRLSDANYRRRRNRWRGTVLGVGIGVLLAGIMVMVARMV